MEVIRGHGGRLRSGAGALVVSVAVVAAVTAGFFGLRHDAALSAAGSGPAARSGAAMAYDPATGDVVMLGARTRPVRRLQTPGCGMDPAGRLRPRPARPPGTKLRWPGTPRASGSSCSAASVAPAARSTPRRASRCRARPAPPPRSHSGIRDCHSGLRDRHSGLRDRHSGFRHRRAHLRDRHRPVRCLLFRRRLHPAPGRLGLGRQRLVPGRRRPGLRPARPLHVLRGLDGHRRGDREDRAGHRRQPGCRGRADRGHLRLVRRRLRHRGGLGRIFDRAARLERRCGDGQSRSAPASASAAGPAGRRCPSPPRPPPQFPSRRRARSTEAVNPCPAPPA